MAVNTEPEAMFPVDAAAGAFRPKKFSVHAPDAAVVPNRSVVVLAMEIAVSRPFRFDTDEKSNGRGVDARGNVSNSGVSDRARLGRPGWVTKATPDAPVKLQEAMT